MTFKICILFVNQFTIDEYTINVLAFMQPENQLEFKPKILNRN